MPLPVRPRAVLRAGHRGVLVQPWGLRAGGPARDEGHRADHGPGRQPGGLRRRARHPLSRERDGDQRDPDGGRAGQLRRLRQRIALHSAGHDRGLHRARDGRGTGLHAGHGALGLDHRQHHRAQRVRHLDGQRLRGALPPDRLDDGRRHQLPERVHGARRPRGRRHQRRDLPQRLADLVPDLPVPRDVHGRDPLGRSAPARDRHSQRARGRRDRHVRDAPVGAPRLRGGHGPGSALPGGRSDGARHRHQSGQARPDHVRRDPVPGRQDVPVQHDLRPRQGRGGLPAVRAQEGRVDALRQ